MDGGAMNGDEKMRAVRKNKELVFRFVELINRGDSTGLAEMMADGFRFTDIAGEVFTVNGRGEKKKFWNDYFRDYPRYRIVMDLMLSSGADVAFIGKTCDSHVPRSVEINETLIWFAGIVNDKVSEWRIFSTEGYAF
jgi:ketosteroid isomerase-like protein